MENQIDALKFCRIFSVSKINVDNDKINDEVNDENTGCSTIQTTLNDSVFAATPNDVSNNTAQLVDVSQALINLEETQTVASCEQTEEAVSNSNETVPDNLMEFDVPSPELAEDVSIVKVQPSDCSVITVSSEGSQATTTTQEIHNKSMENMFERSISCPPLEPPEDLFENCSPENDEQLEQQMDTTYNLNDENRKCIRMVAISSGIICINFVVGITVTQFTFDW